MTHKETIQVLPQVTTFATFAIIAAAQGASNVELATAMGHRTLSQLLRYSSLDAKRSKNFSDHISERILKGSTHE